MKIEFQTELYELMRFGKFVMFSLLCLFTRQITGRKPLVDYSQSHVVTSNQYLDIVRKKTMDKTIAEEIRRGKQKGKKEKMKIVVDLGTTID